MNLGFFIFCLISQIYATGKGILYSVKEKQYLNGELNFTKKKDKATVFLMKKFRNTEDFESYFDELSKGKTSKPEFFSLITPNSKILIYKNKKFKLTRYDIGKEYELYNTPPSSEIKYVDDLQVLEKIPVDSKKKTFKLAHKTHLFKIENNRLATTKDIKKASIFTFEKPDDLSTSQSSELESMTANSSTESTKTNSSGTSTPESSTDEKSARSGKTSTEKTKKKKSSEPIDKKDKAQSTKPEELNQHVKNLTQKHQDLIKLLNNEETRQKALKDMEIEMEKMEKEIAELKKQLEDEKKTRDDAIKTAREEEKTKLSDDFKAKEEDWLKKLEDKDKEIEDLKKVIRDHEKGSRENDKAGKKKKEKRRKKNKNKKDDSSCSTSSEDSCLEIITAHPQGKSPNLNTQQYPQYGQQNHMMNCVVNAADCVVHSQQAPVMPYQPTPAQMFQPNQASIQKMISNLTNLMGNNCMTQPQPNDCTETITTGQGNGAQNTASAHNLMQPTQGFNQPQQNSYVENKEHRRRSRSNRTDRQNHSHLHSNNSNDKSTIPSIRMMENVV